MLGEQFETFDFGNSILIDSRDDIATKYDWLKSGDRDGQMGAMSATNRRTLILSPGLWTVTAEIDFDTDCVDVTEWSDNPEDVVITRAGGGSTVVQTADDVRLSNFTIRNTGSSWGDHAFEIDASDNSASVYRRMHFRHTFPGGSLMNCRCSVWGTSDINGTWIHCEGDGWSWRVAENKVLGATMWDCVAGPYSYGGDNTGVDITGTLYRCIGSDASFGGCASYGCNISGTLIECEAGNKSFAMGRVFSGVALRCIGKRQCFGGYAGGGVANYGKIRGYLEDCVSDGNNSFGMGHASCEISGQIINCRNGFVSEYMDGTVNSGASNVVDGVAAATLTTDLAGANNDVKFTAVQPGKYGHRIQMYYKEKYGLHSVGEITVTLFGTNQADEIVIELLIESGVSTGTEVIDWINGDGDSAALVSAANAPGNDGSGTVIEMAATPLTGGIEPLVLKGNQPWAPKACTANATAYPFDNGHTYTNEGAGGAITLSLPAAKIGFEFDFVVKAVQQLQIDPDGTETIAIDGVQQAAGKYIWADAIGERCKAKCVKAGEWETELLGTWTAEV